MFIHHLQERERAPETSFRVELESRRLGLKPAGGDQMRRIVERTDGGH
jgi:hypothetical protein